MSRIDMVLARFERFLNHLPALAYTLVSVRAWRSNVLRRAFLIGFPVSIPIWIATIALLGLTILVLWQIFVLMALAATLVDQLYGPWRRLCAIVRRIWMGPKARQGSPSTSDTEMSG